LRSWGGKECIEPDQEAVWVKSRGWTRALKITAPEETPLRGTETEVKPLKFWEEKRIEKEKEV